LRRRESGCGGIVLIFALIALFTGRYVFLLPFAVLYFVPLLIVLFVFFLVGRLIRTAASPFHEDEAAEEWHSGQAYTSGGYRRAAARRYRQAYAETPEYTVEAADESPSMKILDNGIAQMRQSVTYFRQLGQTASDAGLKRDIETICVFSDKLVSAAETDDTKRAAIRKFLNYYLPVLYKLAAKHAELEAMHLTSAQSVQIKAKITGAVSKAAEAFEVKLNSLYENEILDIDSEISVLETMLAKDGLTVNKDFESVLRQTGTDMGAAAPDVGRSSIELILDEVNASVDEIDKLVAKVK
jgi:hypothetical protein